MGDVEYREEDNYLDDLRDELERARELLREWRDKYEAKERKLFSTEYGTIYGASPSDLYRETDLFLRGK